MQIMDRGRKPNLNRSHVVAASAIVLFGIGFLAQPGSAITIPGVAASSQLAGNNLIRAPEHAQRIVSARIKQGSQWTIELNIPNYNSCEVLTFSSSGTFTGDLFNDLGTYSTGSSSVRLIWTSGGSVGLKFNGTYNDAKKEYRGPFGGYLKGDTGQLVRGAISSWDGSSC
jgi:hypothetical protein